MATKRKKTDPAVGRPRLSRTGEPSVRLEIKLPPEEKEKYQQIAKEAGMTLSEWFRALAAQHGHKRF